MMLALLVTASAAFAASPATSDVSSLKASAPVLVCELDLKVLKGELRRLSWSVDGRYLHVQTLERKTLRDYIVKLPEGEISAAFGEPEWADQYWTMKSSLAAPGAPDLKIEVLEDHQRTQPNPFAGGFNSVGGAQTGADPHNARDTFAIEARLLLLGQEVGYTLNEVAIAGASYGWGPPGTGTIAFIDTAGRVTLFDRARHKNVVATAKGAMMPAWSGDGRRLAYVQKAGRDRFRLMTLAIE
jgi:hypothetical protein